MKQNPAGTKINQQFYRTKHGHKAHTLSTLLKWRDALKGPWLTARQNKSL